MPILSPKWQTCRQELTSIVATTPSYRNLVVADTPPAQGLILPIYWRAHQC